jgi:hypothetical protein
MKSLSESLMQLASRVKALEASAAAARDRNREALEERRSAIQQTIESDGDKFRATQAEAKAKVDTWGADVRSQIDRRVAEMKTRFEQWQSARVLEDAQVTADIAEDDAAVAVDIAAYCLDAAEYAVVQAALARSEADSLAAAKSGSSV